MPKGSAFRPAGQPGAATAPSSSPITRDNKRPPARSTGWSPAAGTAIPARPTHPPVRVLRTCRPSVRLPYPWARSVNGLEFADTGGGFGPLEGQLVLCEYNNRFILRASLETVDGQEQGACYPFLGNLLGPLCLAFSPTGVLYVGSIREPAWGGEPEQGAIYRVTYSGQPVVRHPGSHGAARRLRRLTFLAPPADPSAAADPAALPDPPLPPRLPGLVPFAADRRGEPPRQSRPQLEPDGRTVHLSLREPPRADRIYEIRTTLAGADPEVAHYTMNHVPRM